MPQPLIKPHHKVILFPLETYVREIDFRLVLALHLLKPGRQILLGNHTDIYRLTQHLRSSVYVGKCLHNVSPVRQRDCYDHAKQNDVRVVYLHEEGGVFENDLAHWRHELFRRLMPDWLAADDHFCSWGKVQADIYRETKPVFDHHIHVTGHPRFDLCKERFAELYAAESRSIRQEHGKFVLINTNFGHGTYASGNGYFFEPPRTPLNDRDKRRFFTDYFAYDTGQYAAFIRLIDHLEANLPDHRIIVRPHPSEETGYYTDLLKRFERVRVVRHGSLNAWLKACHTLVHSGCTTGIEGALCGARVISFTPQKNAQFSKRIPNLAGVPASTQEEVLSLIQDESWKGGLSSLSPEAAQELGQLFANFQDDQDSFASFVRVIEQCLDEAPETTVVKPLDGLLWKGRIENMKNTARKLLPRQLHLKSHANLHARQKFSGFIASDVTDKLEALSSILNRHAKVLRVNKMVISLTSLAPDV
jgi:surface carbohydrate biosynthesis protein